MVFHLRRPWHYFAFGLAGVSVFHYGSAVSAGAFSACERYSTLTFASA